MLFCAVMVFFDIAACIWPHITIGASGYDAKNALYRYLKQ